jgi:HEAT repeat protein
VGIFVVLCVMAFAAYLALHNGTGHLTDQQVSEFLRDESDPNGIVYALRQIDARRLRQQPVKQWYPELLRLTGSRFEQVRYEVARSMGEDTSYPEFRGALEARLLDPSLLVRNAAALSLARFGDATGHNQIIDMLQPVRVGAPVSGRIDSALSPGADVGHSTVIASIRNGGTQIEVHAPVSGRVRSMLVQEGDVVSGGVNLAIIDPGAEQVVAALRALQHIGYPEDLALLTPYTRTDSTAPLAVREQAAITQKAIRDRNKDKS